ncbi:hypothetical protein [Bacillus sp. UMB0728]|uniref:hypothetical protein n=1 Tax=Bacillus sp. UMB0728 TaxID=2066052 RepID=UPI000C76C2CF|nr:hypothetical protein [Bacillus sp. UMB0728]PLR73660.1 hypothetical protein CYJ37_09035 [Bacillus sp. UMB0728]
MKKKIAVLTSSIALVSMLAGAGYAAEPAHGMIAEASVQSVQKADSTNLQIKLLEEALAPVSAKDAAGKWSKALANRNGAAQNALFTPALKKKYKSYFESYGWVTGGSSPWVSSHKVTKEKKLSSTAYEYTIHFSLVSSSGKHGSENAVISVKKSGSTWLIEKVYIKPDSIIGSLTPYTAEPVFTYRAAEYAFSIPQSWDMKYTAAEKEGSLVFSYKPANKKISSRTLFSIEKIKLDTWKKDGYEEGLHKKLGEKNGFVYAMLPSSENQYNDMPDSIEYKEYHQMSLQLKAVRDSFMFIN